MTASKSVTFSDRANAWKVAFDDALEQTLPYLQSIHEAADIFNVTVVAPLKIETWQQMGRTAGHYFGNIKNWASGAGTFESEFPRLSGWVQRPHEMYQKEVVAAETTYLNLALLQTGRAHDWFHSFVTSFASAIPIGAYMAYGAAPFISGGMSVSEFASSSANIFAQGTKTVTRMMDDAASSFTPPLAFQGAYGGVRIRPTAVAVADFGGPLATPRAMPIMMPLGAHTVLVMKSGGDPTDDRVVELPEKGPWGEKNGFTQALERVKAVRSPFANEIFGKVLNCMKEGMLTPVEGEAVLVALSEVLKTNEVLALRGFTVGGKGFVDGAIDALTSLTKRVTLDGGTTHEVTFYIDLGKAGSTLNPSTLTGAN
ncbi:MAG: hypothetical protein Q8P84_08740 [Deltaproteobacteria bacterium]|nr:hypothetical protein [Deltaproteobacteria bacterium]